MGSTWDHPDLGRFKYERMAWRKTVNVPAFKLFAYDTGYSNARRSTGKHELTFDADDEHDIPSQAAVRLASKVLMNQADLVTKVTKALWDDFNGRGPNSGLWWHGALNEVAEAMDAEEPLGGPDDLLAVMQLSQILVWKRVDDYEKPVVELSFLAAFEPEHGVGVLTDGETILGTGYMVDVVPFKPKRRPSGRGR
jgi:uncharacterized protein DUF6985